jgi:hypothetical protein
MIINEHNDVQKTTIQLGKDENMKKVFITLVIFVSFTAFAFAAGGKNHGLKGKGNTGTTGKGQTTQNRGN